MKNTARRKHPVIKVLLYHEIGPYPRESANLDCFCAQSLFREQMRLLKASGIPVLTAADACATVGHVPRPNTDSVVLTFDDGDAGFLEYALPVLQEFSFPATVFAVAGQLGQRAGWVKDSRNAIPLMTAQQLRSLDPAQIDVGSHSMTHRKLTDVSLAEATDELGQSKALLEDVLGRPVTAFAYPHGRYNAHMMQLVEAAGYRYAYSTDGERIFGDPADRFRLPRKYITYYDNLDTFKAKVQSC